MSDCRVEIVRSTLPTSGSTVDITFSGLEDPKFAVFIATRADVDATEETHASICFGFCTDSVQRVHACASEDGVSPGANTWHKNDSARCIALIDPTDGSVDGELSFNSFLSNGVRLDVDGAASASWKLTTLLFAGTKMECDAGNFTTTTDGNPVAITGMGFAPKAAFFWPRTASSGVSSEAFAVLGAAFDDQVDDPEEVFQTWTDDDKGSGNTELALRASSREVSARLAVNGTISATVEVDSFDSDGLSVVGAALEATDGTYLAFTTGGACEMFLGLGTLPTTAPSTWAETGVGFPPQFVFLWQNHTHLPNTNELGARAGTWGLAAFTPDDESAHNARSRDNQSTSAAGSWADAKAASIITGTGLNGTIGTFSSMDSDGFSLSMTDVGTPARRWPFLAISEDRSLAGSADADLAAAGDLSITVSLSGTASASLSSQADLSLRVSLGGSASPQLSPAAALSLTVGLAGTAAHTSAASAELAARVSLTGTASLSLNALGSLGARVALSGVAALQVTAAGDLQAVPAGGLSGTAGLSLAAAGSLGLSVGLSGSSDQVLTASASFADTGAIAEIMANAAKAVRTSVNSAPLTIPVAYPNTRFVRPAGAFAELAIRAMSMRIVAVGGGPIQLRLDGSAVVTFYGRPGRLDQVHRQQAQLLAEHLEGSTSVGGVRFLGTAISSPRAQSGRWALDLAVNFTDRGEVENTSSPAIEASSFDQVADAMRARFETEVSVPESLHTIHDDMLRPRPGQVAEWARVSVLDGTTSNREDSGVRSFPVNLGVQIFTPLLRGDGRAWELASRAAEAFVSLHDAGITYLDTEASVAGAGTSYWQTNITCRATYERASP